MRCSIICANFNCCKIAGRNRPNVQGKENFPAQHAVKIVPHCNRIVYVQEPLQVHRKLVASPYFNVG